MERKIDLNLIKVAIFDFDDTLAIHKNKDYKKQRSESKENNINYYLSAYLYPDSFYESIEPCLPHEDIYHLIKFLARRNVKMYCLSGMKFSFNLKAKENFIRKHYGEDIEVLFSRNQETKIEAIEILKKLHNCNYNEILFVDDFEENVKILNDLGINSFLPDEISLLDLKQI